MDEDKHKLHNAFDYTTLQQTDTKSQIRSNIKRVQMPKQMAELMIMHETRTTKH